MKAALYARVSTTEQEVDQQVSSMIERAMKEGWDYEVVIEKETTRKTRPRKNEVYNKALKKEFDIVCVYSIDRWARSVVELAREITNLYNKGVKFVSISDPIDLSTDTGWLQFTIISAFAEFERRVISRRIKDSFYRDKSGITRSIKSDKPVGKRGKDKKRRKKSGYYLRHMKNTCLFGVVI